MFCWLQLSNKKSADSKRWLNHKRRCDLANYFADFLVMCVLERFSVVHVFSWKREYAKFEKTESILTIALPAGEVISTDSVAETSDTPSKLNASIVEIRSDRFRPQRKWGRHFELSILSSVNSVCKRFRCSSVGF